VPAIRSLQATDSGKRCHAASKIPNEFRNRQVQEPHTPGVDIEYRSL
jgi:hypothetical protein